MTVLFVDDDNELTKLAWGRGARDKEITYLPWSGAVR